MHQSFNSIDSLFEYIKEDKEWSGAEAAMRNRYPIRFVLFDNFSDFNEFIINRPIGIYKHSIDTMLDPDYPDAFLSYTELSKEIRSFVKKIPINDFIIYPFSEMARFYDNTDNKEFDSLVTTIRGTQAPEDAQGAHVRIYIPIVGMQGKMGRFINDHTTFVWEYKSGTDKGTYKLVLTNGTTYGVKGLSSKYSIVNNLSEWLRLWEKGADVKSTIICSSTNIFANARYAQPDNAFTYFKCKNAYQFLTGALGFDFGLSEEPGPEEMPYWEKLARLIDIDEFDFDEFVKERLDTFTLHTGSDFIKSWFDCETDFDRWLLSLYFRKVANRQGYIYRTLTNCATLSNSSLYSVIATSIFEEPNKEAWIEERRQAMVIGARKGVNITDFAREKLKAKLQAMASTPESGGIYLAAKLLTPLTDEERRLAIEWSARGLVQPGDIKHAFHGLYDYMKPLGLSTIETENQWIADYFDAYRKSKIANRIAIPVNNILSEKNSSPTTFQLWRDNFKTVKTILHKREDIDIIYWIDGLGVDWVPFIREIIARYEKEHVYLNEIYIASADIPTTTAINKSKLQSLLPEGKLLPKIGDLDVFAHTSKSYPQYIIDEMAIVEQSLEKILEEYNGKKIAIVSDHGLTYLSQLEDGLKLAGVKPDHEGRIAMPTDKNFSQDNKYIVLNNGEIISSLTHKSLTGKVDKGHGAHGGCTPEEVLVPIFIISASKNANTYSVKLKNDEIDGSNPIVALEIRGLTSIDVPSVTYNGADYALLNRGNDLFESERLNLVDTATKVSVKINHKIVDTFSIKVSTGASEDDLFDGF